MDWSLKRQIVLTFYLSSTKNRGLFNKELTAKFMGLKQFQSSTEFELPYKQYISKIIYLIIWKILSHFHNSRVYLHKQLLKVTTRYRQIYR